MRIDSCSFSFPCCAYFSGEREVVLVTARLHWQTGVCAVHEGNRLWRPLCLLRKLHHLQWRERWCLLLPVSTGRQVCAVHGGHRLWRPIIPAPQRGLSFPTPHLSLRCTALPGSHASLGPHFRPLPSLCLAPCALLTFTFRPTALGRGFPPISPSPLPTGSPPAVRPSPLVLGTQGQTRLYCDIFSPYKSGRTPPCKSF